MINHKLISIVGILASSIFIGGFLLLFAINPKTLDEINNLSLFIYNLIGMDGRLWAALVIYLTVGTLNILFALGLLITFKSKSTIVIGKILLLTTGLIWATFGLFTTDTQTSVGGNLFLLRIIAITLTGAIGLIILGAEFEKIHQSKFLKWYTLSSGLAILLLAILSTEVYTYQTNSWMRTNVSILIYFGWFGVFGVTYLVNTKSVNAAK